MLATVLVSYSGGLARQSVGISFGLRSLSFLG